jgi:catechol 2,3-dioxygenase-like lactoylglutathione lyase family enzyme
MNAPALRADHVGLTVPNIEQATQFFEQILGAARLFDTGPFAAQDNWMAENLGVDPRAEIRVLRMLGLPGGGMLELFEYQAPGQKADIARNSDIGGYHAAFWVPDIDAAAALLYKHGVEVMGPVKTVTTGPSRGLQWVYFKAPWGVQLEFVSYPQGWPLSLT